MNEGHILEFRQRVASFDKEEVKIACDILAATHPADYLNALVRNYKRLLESHEAAGAVFKQFQEEHQELIGEKIPEEDFQKTFVEFSEKDAESFLPKYEGEWVENKEIDPKEIEVPDFLK